MNRLKPYLSNKKGQCFRVSKREKLIQSIDYATERSLSGTYSFKVRSNSLNKKLRRIHRN